MMAPKRGSAASLLYSIHANGGRLPRDATSHDSARRPIQLRTSPGRRSVNGQIHFHELDEHRTRLIGRANWTTGGRQGRLPRLIRAVDALSTPYDSNVDDAADDRRVGDGHIPVEVVSERQEKRLSDSKGDGTTVVCLGHPDRSARPGRGDASRRRAA